MSIILLMAMFVSIQSSSKSIVKCGSRKINIPEYAEDYQVVEIETRYYFMYMPVANAIFSIVSKSLTGYSVTHSYDVLKVYIPSEKNWVYYAAQMTGDGAEMDGYWRCKSSVDQDFGGCNYHSVYVKRTYKPRPGTTVGDIKRWVQARSNDYCMGNNCQDFSHDLFHAFNNLKEEFAAMFETMLNHQQNILSFLKK